jgi:L-histidine N-alpha-methyltransferase
LGCGNGIASYPVLEELQRRKIKFKYIPIDISKELLNMAVKNVKAKFGNVECKAFQLDFESGNFSDVIYELKEGDSVNLLLFLGSTLGNFSDRNRILTNFRDSMSSDDYLIIGVELTNLYKIHKILPYYRGKLTEDFLYFIPEKIGIKRKDTIFDVGWNESKKQIEARMILRKDIEVKIGSEKFILEKGEQILLGISVKFTEETLTKLLSDVGFRTELLTTSEDRGYILSMVQPTRYSI